MKNMRKFQLQPIPFAEGDNVNINKLGMRSKLGGNPDWEQSDETPQCNSCKNNMTFVAQIDSIAQDEEHNPNRIDSIHGEQDYMFGDVGMIYVFFCFDCLETKSVFQCT
jgi:uncharacterized protein YwqG